ncbi:MAG: calcineurin-like phosphoesterase family protein [Myxococcota bacterium]|nr:calcineurin-like phosphoesterase family protein [Myxococcota bacterium]
MRLLAIAILAALSIAAPTALRAETAVGFVFEDRNADGVRDAGEPGLAGVRVSNGRDLVRTDESGRYEIDATPPVVLFVVKPAGFQTPVSADMLPRFYYVHQPEGSPPGLRYAGVAPTGPLPESVDFPLRRATEPSRFEAILFADTQPQSHAEVDFIRDDIVSELIGTEALFGMTLGDIMFDDLSLLPRFNAVIGQIGVPWYNVPGNHELNFLAEDDAGSLETFKRFFGPPYYSFDVGDAHFVVLDNIEYKGNGESDPGDYRGSGGYEARIGEAQLRWLEKDLALVPDDQLVFLAMHAPLRTYSGETERPQANTQDRRELFELLEGREHLYSVAGHTHTTEHHHFGEEDGFDGPGTFHHHVLTTVSGSWWSGPIDERGIAVAEQRDGTPNGYHVLEVDGTDLAVRYKAAGRPADYQMRILFDATHHHHRAEVQDDFRHGELLDGRLNVDEVAATHVVVNFFDGGPKTELSFQVGDGPYRPMTRRRTFDPFVKELFARHRESVKPWVKAEPSSHVFEADLPDELRPGTYTVTVRAKDEFGRTHHAHRVLEVEGSSAPGGELRWPANCEPEATSC